MLGPGSLVGPYRLLRKLGEGGMGAVYEAQHARLDLRAAIKVLLPHFARDPEIVHRFHNEANAAARLRHPNIVSVLDFGETPGGEWYLAMEFLDGVPLSKLIASGPLDLRTTVKLIAQVCAALQAAHDHGIVHRDVKPDNAIVTGIGVPGADELVKLVDFGIAKVREGARGVETRDNVAMGTPCYMAPEQLRDAKNIDGRADVYALGVVVYEMLTGVRPWGEEYGHVRIHEMATAELHRLDPRHAPIAPGAARPEIPEAVAAVVRCALDPAPSRRWRTPRDFVLALARAVPGTAWSPDAMDLVVEYAKGLTVIPDDAETAGRAVPSSPSGAAGPGAITAPARPAVAVAPSGARGPGMPTPMMSPGLGATPAPASAPPAAVAAAMPTTLGSAASQIGATAPGGPPRRRWALTGGLAVGGALVAALVVVAVTRGGGSSAGPPPTTEPAARPSESAAMSALAIVTDPAGAAISVDGVPKGPAPVNVPVPVGAEVVVLAELDGHAPKVERVRVGAEPGALRVQLAAVAAPAPHAGNPEPPTTPSGDRTRGRTRPQRDRDARSSPPAPDAGTSSGPGATPRPPRYNPDDVPGE